MEKLMKRYVLNTFGALAVGVGLPFLMAAGAYAQDPAPAAAGEATTERVVVTGSYIPTAETESALPVTVYTAEVLQKQGANTPVEGLRQLPSFVGNTTTENDSNGGDGSASISLRGLGPENTLTLINGRRAFLQVAGVTFTNINTIPLGAISRVEVLKDGASSVYGSDAVSGVVNFIFLNGPGEAPYEGAELDMLYGNTTDSDANVRQIYLRGGVTGLDGKVSIAAVAEYYKRAELSTRDREIAVEADRRFLGGNNQGSSTFAGRVTYRSTGGGTTGAIAAVLRDATNNAPLPGAPSPSYRQFFPGNDDTAFNFRIFTPSIPAQEKYQYYVTGRYKIFGEGLQLYGDLLYAKNKQDNGLAASPFALGAGSANSSPFNPFRTFGPGSADDQLRSVSYRSVRELGNRKSFFDYDFWRYTVGFNGDFSVKDSSFVNNWGYDVGYVFHRTDQLRIDSGDAQFTPLEASLRGQGPDGSFYNPFIGQNAPLQGVAPTYVDGVQTGTLAYDNTAALQAASYLGRSFFYNRSYLYDAKAYANLFPGLYNGGIGMTIGYEHREQREHSIPDPVQAAGDQLGFNAAPLTKYYQEVDSYFGELRVPLVISTMNIPGVHSLEVNFAYRFEKFDNKDQFFKDTASFDNDGTPRISVRYQPIPDLTLRASWGQSFQSPFAFQLFDPAAQNFPVLFDVNLGTTLQPPGGVFQAGALDLQPEATDSYSAGVVYTPKWLPGFTTTIDIYQVYTKSVIVGAADFAQILLSLNNADGSFVDPDGPGLGIFPDEDGVIGGPGLGITRDETGALFAIDSQTANAGKRLVNGLDITMAYQLPWTNWGQFTLSGGYNYFFTWKAEALPGAGFTNFLGDYNNGTLPLAPGAIPYHKAFLRGEHEWKGFDFVATMNYISSFNDDGAFVLAARPIGGTGAQPAYPFYRRVSDYITLDMQLSYEFKRPEAVAATDTKSYSKDGKSVSTPVAGADSSSIWERILWGTTIRVGCNNVFDRNPPTVLGAFNDNYDTSLYSIRNRYYYIGLNKKF